ncbi:RluA family pseudouridine synthase [Desulfococcus sp.]|uniref:RluA family pseudouridine synthase n=1 Tax=Desulfococcus sp. TaxID=2025834 RepID=UPI0035938135
MKHPCPLPAGDPDLLREGPLKWGRGWLAVSKPTGISLHNDPGHDLLSAMAQYVETHGELAEAMGYDAGFGIHLPHRLDKETSGIVIMACAEAAHRWISRQFEEKRVVKEYNAIVHGDLAIPQGALWGEWAWPLSKTAGGRSNPAGTGKKVHCLTRYRSLCHSPRYTLIACEPVTGRMHQIRRHARMAGHAVVGDARYGTPQSIRHLKSMGFSRLALHAASITLVLPETASPATLASPGLPVEMIRLMEQDLAGKQAGDGVIG